MYSSTFTELVQMLKETQKNWLVNIGTEENGSEKPWQAQLSLRWTLEGLATQQTLPQQAFNGFQAVLSSSSWVPQRFKQVEQRVILSLSRKQRQVFVLVDGTRSAERIAAVLCQPIEVAAQVLYALEATGVITVE